VRVKNRGSGSGYNGHEISPGSRVFCHYAGKNLQLRPDFFPGNFLSAPGFFFNFLARKGIAKKIYGPQDFFKIFFFRKFFIL
jgi:hypothetical protein